jgi:hypothetical protein
MESFTIRLTWKNAKIKFGKAFQTKYEIHLSTLQNLIQTCFLLRSLVMDLNASMGRFPNHYGFFSIAFGSFDWVHELKLLLNEIFSNKLFGCMSIFGCACSIPWTQQWGFWTSYATIGQCSRRFPELWQWKS